MSGATYLSVVNHAANHALGEVEAVQVLLCHFCPSPHPDRALNVLVLSREGALALLLVQPVIVLVAHVVEGPEVVLGHIGSQNGLVRGAIQTGVALEIGAEFAQTSSRGQHLLH
jgi:hypothetical protein